MISARTALARQLRSVFSNYLMGVVDPNTIRQAPEELAALPDPAKPNRRNPLGKYREMVKFMVGDIVLTARSPEDAPPLGSIELTVGDKSRFVGELNSTSLRTVAQIIRAEYEQPQPEVANG